MTAITQARTTPHNTVRFCYHHDDDIIYTGEATVEYRTYNEQYEGGGYHTVNIETCWQIGTDAPEEIHPADIPMDVECAIMEECLQEFTYPSGRTIDLPSDWDGFEILETEYVYVMNTEKLLPLAYTKEQVFKLGLSHIKRIEYMEERPGVKYPIRVYSKSGISDTIKELAAISRKAY